VGKKRNKVYVAGVSVSMRLPNNAPESFLNWINKTTSTDWYTILKDFSEGNLITREQMELELYRSYFKQIPLTPAIIESVSENTKHTVVERNESIEDKGNYVSSSPQLKVNEKQYNNGESQNKELNIESSTQDIKIEETVQINKSKEELGDSTIKSEQNKNIKVTESTDNQDNEISSTPDLNKTHSSRKIRVSTGRSRRNTNNEYLNYDTDFMKS
jgi:hypothetical protein